MVGAAFGLGFILGPAIGGLLAGFGPRAPFLVAGGIAMLNAIWIFFWLPETLAPEKRRPFDWKQAHVFGAFRALRHAGGAAPLLLAAFLWQLGHVVYPSTWAFWAELALGWNAREIGLSLAASGFSMALVQMLLTGRAIKRFGEARTVVIGMVAAGCAFIGYTLTTQTWVVYTIIVVSAFQGFVFPSINALLSRMTDSSHQGALMGGMSSIQSVAAVIGPLAMTQALAFGAEHGETGGNFLLAAALSFASLAIVYFGVVRRLGRAPA
jgi:DHA1 family tetracycline resistance protein-like MFS transporter